MIAIAFLGTTLEARIANSQDVNKDSYLRAIADRIITGPGDPADWGTNETVPTYFGLADSSLSASAYTLDSDKISRLNSQNIASLNYLDLENSTRLTDIALAITVTQIMNIEIEPISNQTIGNNITFDFRISTTINAQPNSATLHCYVVTDESLGAVNGTTNNSGSGSLTVQVPTVNLNDALLVVFARSSFDDKITSYIIYTFADSKQETIPSNTELGLSPLNGNLNYNSSNGFSVQKVHALTYSYQQTPTAEGSQFVIPASIDHSPSVLVVCAGSVRGNVEEWTAYPQVPLSVGSNFANSERNVFTYTVTIDGVLYDLQLSLGALNK